MIARSTLAAALVAVVGAAAAAPPSKFHIAYAGDDGMRVGWKTDVAAPSACNYGTSPGVLNSTATGTSVSYFPGGGFHHAVRLGGLQRGTRYYYRCGNATGTYSFMSAAAATATVNTLVFGDWGYLGSLERGAPLPVGGLDSNWSAVPSRKLMESLLRSEAYDQVWHVGDIAYQDDSFGIPQNLLNFTYEEVYDGWFDWIQNSSAIKPYMVAVGNHESECHSPACILDLDGLGLHLNNFSAYNARWPMPGPESGGVLSMWFSWNVGSVHFVSIDTSTDFPNAPEGTTGDSGFPELPAGHFAADGEYMKWLESDLAAAAANPSIRWIVAGGHRPFEDFDNAAVAALFKKYGVAMYFAGHGHSYSRYSPTAWGDGAIHIMAGGAGCDEMGYPKDQLAVTGRLPEGGLAAAAACRSWCTDPAVIAGFNRPLLSPASAAALGIHATPITTPVDPCRYCTGAGLSVEPPLVTSGLYALGVLEATPNALTFHLLRAPDALVLDSVTVNHA